MGKGIIKLGEFYLEWSTVVDAPVTFGMTLPEFKEYYRQEYGRDGMKDLPDRLGRVSIKGTSFYDDIDLTDTVEFNRAGPGETHLSREELHRAYCLREPIRDGWLPR